MILIRSLSIPSIPGTFLTEDALLPPRFLRRRMEDQVAVLRWLDFNLLEWQGKGKSGPGFFVLSLSGFPLDLRSSSTGFVIGKLIFETPPCVASHMDGRLRCRIFSSTYSLLA
ncbi:hypothetical protein AVEN_233431-1 [Araneus ventricosus]|uniref:Uncharacterized protein n=1 Tax=Araneus ventricosus TaxID=182803 RepID=A0A4Y2R025_ARAVE|nr:hypothetical protein AVEN_233431-1 [Araneus ventricosus]